MAEYIVEVKSRLRPDTPLTRAQQAEILADIARVLRKYNGGGGGKVKLVEVDMGITEAPTDDMPDDAEQHHNRRAEERWG